MYKRLHDRYAIKVQFNLFYETNGFDLSCMTEKYKTEWQKNCDWLKLSFHSRIEDVDSYKLSGYDEVFRDCSRVHREIVRFASPDCLAKTTTVHYCYATCEGLRALSENGVRGLLGLYGSEKIPRTSYQNTEKEAELLRHGNTLMRDGITYSGIDIILNSHPIEEILPRLQLVCDRDFVKVMIHEQYFYPDYKKYHPNFEEKLNLAFRFLFENGFSSIFFEELL